MPTTITLGAGSGGVGTRTVTISCVLSSTVIANQDNFAPILSNANSNGGTTPIDLANGFNTITIPTTAGGCVFIPPTANVTTITLKGVTGDTGVVMKPSAPFVLAFANPPPASFGLTAGGVIAGCLAIWI